MVRVTASLAVLLCAGTDALLSSFDSINVMRPPAATGQAPGAAWWHTDQAPRRNGLECIQGLLNLTPCGLDAGVQIKSLYLMFMYLNIYVYYLNVFD